MNNQEAQLSTEIELIGEVEFFQAEVSNDNRPDVPVMWGEAVQY